MYTGRETFPPSVFTEDLDCLAKNEDWAFNSQMSLKSALPFRHQRVGVEGGVGTGEYICIEYFLLPEV